MNRNVCVLLQLVGVVILGYSVFSFGSFGILAVLGMLLGLIVFSIGTRRYKKETLRIKDRK